MSDQCHARAHASGCGCGFAAGVTATYHHDIERQLGHARAYSVLPEKHKPANTADS
jgi:hypothetical protein